MKKSQLKVENHKENASQKRNVNPRKIASHTLNENHNYVADNPFQDLSDLTRCFYDQQEVRKESANRIRSIVRRRLEEIESVESKKENKDKAYGTEWNDRTMLKKIAEAHKKGKLSDEDKDYLTDLLSIVTDLKGFENKFKSKLNRMVADEPIYRDYLLKIRGISFIIASNLMGNLGYCENFETPSKLWAYCGLAVDSEGHAVRRKKGEKINYNPHMKTLAWKISDSFIKQGQGYRKFYDQFKKTYTNRKDLKEAVDKKVKGAKMHIDLMARRKTVKLFLSHYWQTAREMKGLPCKPTYVHGKLKHGTIIEPFIDKPSKE